MSSKRSVTVYGFNMRGTVPIESPNDPLFKIVERFCLKHNLDPNKFGLKHRTKQLDLSIPWRLSGISSGAKLELISSKSKSGSLVVALQTDQGRIKVHASVDASLMGLIVAAEKQSGFNLLQRADRKGLYLEPCVVYLNNQYDSLDVLKNTSLRSMGITPGSNCVMRISYKETVTLLQVIAQDLEQMIREVSEEQNNLISSPPPSPKASSSSFTSEQEKQLQSAVGNTNLAQEENKMDELQHQVPMQDIEPSDDNNTLGLSQEASDSSSGTPPWENVKVLVPKEQADRWEITPDMFEVSPADIQRIQKQTSARREMEQTLMTQEMRQRMKRKHERKYTKCFVRIRFPDGYMLQGTFKPAHRLRVVRRFVQESIANPNLKFHFYTTPPKQVLSDESQSLKSLNFVPASVLYIGQDSSEEEKPKLKDQLLQTVEQLQAPQAPQTQEQGSKSKKSMFSKPKMSKEKKEKMLKNLLFKKK